MSDNSSTIVGAEDILSIVARNPAFEDDNDSSCACRCECAIAPGPCFNVEYHKLHYVIIS